MSNSIIDQQRDNETFFWVQYSGDDPASGERRIFKLLELMIRTGIGNTDVNYWTENEIANS